MMGNNHVDRKLLLRYAMSEVHTSIAHDRSQIALEDARYIDRHVQECAHCQAQLALMRDAAQVGDELLSKIIEKRLFNHSPQIVKRRVSLEELLSRWAPRVAGAIAVVFVCILLPSLINPQYARQATVEYELGKSELPSPRKPSGLNQGAAYFNKGNYAAAIESFQRSIQSEDEIKDRGLAHLYLGLTFLKVAENRRLVFFYSFDRSLADSAVAHLNAGMKLNAAFPLMQDAALYFSGKAHLMRNDVRAASEALEACVAMRLEKSQAAQKLLKELSKQD